MAIAYHELHCVQFVHCLIQDRGQHVYSLSKTNRSTVNFHGCISWINRASKRMLQSVIHRPLLAHYSEMVDFFNIETVRLRSSRVERNHQTIDDCAYNGVRIWRRRQGNVEYL